MRLNLTKYHGCGNDFLILPESAAQGLDLTKLITAACDRHSGIGADGFILVRKQPLTMLFYNADGSAAPMCGNGIRCFARYCLDEGVADAVSFDVQTGAGVKTVEVVRREPFLARIAMGKPDYRPASVGVDAEAQLWNYPLDVDGETVTLTSFFMSTVHTVWFVDDAMDDRLLPLAEAIHRHPFFREKTNVNMVEVVDRSTLRMRTWERGAGLTLACGTGACASALAAYKKGLCEQAVTVRLPKGELRIEIMPDESVFMTGPAHRILKGDYEYEGQ